MKERGFLRDLFYYMNPKNLSSDIKGYGYSLSVKRTLLLFIAEIIGAVGVGYLFGLTPFFTTIVAVFGILCFPILLKNSYKGRYEQQRFSDITEYMEQMLYSFRANHSVLTSLDESSRSFDEGPMKRTILEAINKINTSQGVHSTQQGLAHIESFYKNNRLRTIHKFMLRVEQIGGCFDSTIDVLLKDREMWVERQNLLRY